MSRVFLVSARRSAIAPRGGALAALALHDLAAPVILQTLLDAGIKRAWVGELILSNALGAGGNPARLAALAAGLPLGVAGLSIDRQCAGGLDALLLGAAMIRAGQHDIVVAGGAESYSRRPLRLRTHPDGRAPEAYDAPPFSPFPDRDPDMAEAADALGRRMNISRAEQDAWAVESHRKALAAAPRLCAEITPIAGLGQDAFARALGPRLTARAQIVTGDITAANMSVAADGAAFCVLVSERVARARGFDAVELIGGATLGDDPAMPGTAPVAAIARALAGAGLRATDLARSEVMEAFAVQAIACQRLAGLDPAVMNLGGGSLARGHPIGASGAVLAVRLYHELRASGGAGLAAIAAAGGIGTALVLSFPR
ncbi:acetyl-CoA C-acyltransferase [Paracoccus lutimaris]|uniref:Acetyl-CoA C-acetyltransferase n=1 Tax=Paracoccus lutimaris TaxID=1490030 RepID=A0A368YKM8_9RHOB|nr:acetyl-CoA C-acyltransferase [Paracoccus lutimaris]RCW80780.1 acetyl-CoA C-acetyltransferase [Paracoccus lutimaris]